MPKAIILDLNGLFFISELLSARIKRKFGVDESVFVPALKEIMAKVRQPDAGPAFGYWEPYLRSWNIPLDEQAFWEFWFGGERLNAEMVELAKALRAKGFLVIILSNNFKERSEYYGHYGDFTECVDKIYFSWQTGFVKPDPQAFEFVLHDNGLQASECIYFDDQEPNVKAAKTLGMHAYLYEGVSQIRHVIFNVDNT